MKFNEPLKKRIHIALEPYTILLRHSPMRIRKGKPWIYIEPLTFQVGWNCGPIKTIKCTIYLIGKKHTVQNMAVGVSLKATLARPKSQILSLQSAFAKIFFGLRSRWKTFAATTGKMKLVKSKIRWKLARDGKSYHLRMATGKRCKELPPFYMLKGILMKCHSMVI